MGSWPHGPEHNLTENGAYIITCGTYRKAHNFGGKERLSLVQDRLFDLAEEYSIILQAWSIFSNHYHIICIAPNQPVDLSKMARRLHSSTAIAVNKLDGTEGRKVWHQFWDTHLTFEKSYYARLAYVHNNPVKHGLVQVANQYPWCSAGWFERNASSSFCKRVMGLKTDKVNVQDDYAPEPP